MNRTQFEKVEIRQQIQTEQDCLRASKTSTYERFKNINGDRIVGTCRWALDHPHYQGWLKNPNNDLLWISADPGCGKSVLSKSLIDNELASTSQRTTCYYFFKDNGQQDRLAPALCAVLHQLLSDQPQLMKHAIPAWEKNGDKVQGEVAILWQILLDAVADDHARDAICILDALDECRSEDRQDLITRLCYFHEQSPKSARSAHSATLKFLVTSRPYDNVQRWFEQTIHRLPQVRLRGEDENDCIRSEIDMVIDQRLAELAIEFHLSKQHQDKLRRRLRDMENRTYLWLYLVMEEIRTNYRNSSDPEETLIKNVPTSVEKAYEQILQKITSEQMPSARRMLLIIVGARRPLTIGEAGLAFNAAKAYESDQSIVKKPNVPHLEKWIREWCGLFVFINHSYLFLIHQTAKEFLLTDLASCNINAGLWQSSLSYTQVEREMAIMCHLSSSHNNRAGCLRWCTWWQ